MARSFEIVSNSHQKLFSFSRLYIKIVVLQEGIQFFSLDNWGQHKAIAVKNTQENSNVDNKEQEAATQREVHVETGKSIC